MEAEHLLPSPFIRLPDEIAVRLLHLGTYQVILRFARTCRQYRDLVGTTDSLQLHIELDVSGMEVFDRASNSNIGYSIMLNDIRVHREAWQNLNFEKGFQKVQHDTSNAMHWEMHNGVLFEIHSSDRHTQDSLVIVPLLNPASRSSLFRFEFPFDAMAVDLSQELLVLADFDTADSTRSDAHINLVSSVTGRPHSAARLPAFSATIRDPNVDFGLPTPSITIMRDMLFIHFSNFEIARYKIFIWNWQSGDLCYIISDVGNLHDIALLDQSHLAALVSGDPRTRKLHLLVYMIHPKTPDDSPSQSAPASSIIPTTPILQLDFPTLCKNVTIAPSGANILMQPDYIPGYPIQIGSSTFSYARIPTLGIRLTLRETPYMIPTISKRFYIFVCVDGLLRLVPSQKSGQSIKWSEWGIDNTRWFVNESEYRQRNAPLVGSSHRGMSGPRYVELINNSEDRGNSRDDEGDKDNGGDKTPVDQRKDKKDEDGLLYVADFKVSHSRMDLDQALTSENQNLIRHGRFPFPAQNYRVSTNIIPETGPGSPHNIPQYYSERMRTILVRSDAPTILGEEDGFDEPVESRLPYRFVAGRRPVPRVISRWLMSHNITAGLQIATPNITAIIYELRPPTQ